MSMPTPRNTHQTERYLIPNSEPDRQEAKDRIVAELHEQGYELISQNESIARTVGKAHLVVTYRPIAVAEQDRQMQRPPETLEAIGDPPDGTVIYDAPAGQVGRDLIADKQTELEAEGQHILTCTPRTTDRPGAIRYTVTYRPRTISEQRVYDAIMHGEPHATATKARRTKRA